MKHIDLNVDIGEGFSSDAALVRLASSANVCCGVHAGSPVLTLGALSICHRAGIRIGAHPGYPDREGMGRRSLEEVPDNSIDHVVSSLIMQIRDVVEAADVKYVKPHGAFYHESAREGEAWTMLLELLALFRLPLMGMPGTEHEAAAARAEVGFIREGFAERSYGQDGWLLPRTSLGALITDPQAAARQAVRLAPTVDSICVHGDSDGCVATLTAVRNALEADGFVVGA